ncbi:MAG: hypothetical protein IJN90_01085 [Bacilli bacterium]|nr:hypothetical protein [Bacilli bacterium]
MKTMKMKKKVHKIYNKLQKKKTAIKIRAFIMAGFLLAVNSFAWFVFISNGNGNITADVISWDIVFLDQEEQVEMLDINLDDLYPGMSNFSRDIVVKNRSDLDATFKYEVEGVIVYGKEYVVEDYIASLQNDFPFKISFTHNKNDLAIGEKLNFTVSVTWPFESSNEYYKLNELYSYMDLVNYYTLSNGTYTKVNITESNFDSYVKNGLYVESDDADTFWGETSVTYKEQFPEESAITLKVKLIVTQKVS